MALFYCLDHTDKVVKNRKKTTKNPIARTVLKNKKLLKMAITRTVLRAKKPQKNSKMTKKCQKPISYSLFGLTTILSTFWPKNEKIPYVPSKLD